MYYYLYSRRRYFTRASQFFALVDLFLEIGVPIFALFIFVDPVSEASFFVALLGDTAPVPGPSPSPASLGALTPLAPGSPLGILFLFAAISDLVV